MPASRGSTPRTGTPVASSADQTSRMCRPDAALLSTTPATWTPGSKVARPWTIAAAVRVMWLTSRASTTGVRVRVATCAVDA